MFLARRHDRVSKCSRVFARCRAAAALYVWYSFDRHSIRRRLRSALLGSWAEDYPMYLLIAVPRGGFARRRPLAGSQGRLRRWPGNERVHSMVRKPRAEPSLTRSSPLVTYDFPGTKRRRSKPISPVLIKAWPSAARAGRASQLGPIASDVRSSSSISRTGRLQSVVENRPSSS